jgi:hypothetical protein
MHSLSLSFLPDATLSISKAMPTAATFKIALKDFLRHSGLVKRQNVTP